MSKEKWQIIGIVIGIIIMALIFYTNLKPKKRNVAVLAPAPLPIPVGVQPPAFVPADSSVLESQKKNAEKAWGRDPFSADPYKAGQASELHLQGISYRRDNVGYAFINNEIVKKGDSVQGWLVVEVYKDKVFLKKGDQSFYLTFPEQ
jgi:hypothetical protein